MKTTLSQASKELIYKFDSQLLKLLKEDSKIHHNLVNFETTRFDMVASRRKVNLKNFGTL